MLMLSVLKLAGLLTSLVEIIMSLSSLRRSVWRFGLESDMEEFYLTPSISREGRLMVKVLYVDQGWTALLTQSVMFRLDCVFSSRTQFPDSEQ